jgi:NADPH-dependent 2,4-dienoyl-CoA reductase/sulfur reductase-like enzyme
MALALHQQRAVLTGGGGRWSLRRVRAAPSTGLTRHPRHRCQRNATASSASSASPPPPPKLKIAVIGAGPCGLTTALALRKFGMEDVTVFDK